MRHPIAITVSFALSAALAACERPPAPDQPTVPAPLPSEPAEPVAQTGGAAQAASPTQGEQGGTDNWRTVMSAEDKDRLERLDEAWSAALARARKDGFGVEVKSLGVLARPDAAMTSGLHPAPGNYRCRTIKMGVRGDVGLGFVSYPYFRCRVELTPGGDLILEKTTGSQRLRGLLYPDTNNRLVYVGTQAWGDEKGYPAYGTKPERDESGVLQRVGNGQWRLVIPFPKQESQLDIIEIVS